jgi:hypothetical protein
MKKIFALIITTTIAFAGYAQNTPEKPEDRPSPPSLLVEPAAVSAFAYDGTYPFAVVCNTIWSATVASDATWCTVSPAVGKGEVMGAITVTANPASQPRTATVTFSSGALKKILTVTQAAQPVTPRYAASTQTWTFGDQTWSDAIQMPDCNKETFEKTDTDPQCRSYTAGSNTWYYYNWPYVNQHAALLCPLPWRVSTKGDFAELNDNTGANSLIAAWSYGGYTDGSSMENVSSDANYWSSSEYSRNLNYAYYLYYDSGELRLEYVNKNYGLQVRCVK